VRADGTAIGVTRVAVTKDGFGNVRVYMATPSIGVAAPDLVVIGDLFKGEAEPRGVTSFALSATPLSQAITYSVWLYDDAPLTVAEFTVAVSLALTAFFSEQPIGGNIADSGGKIYAEVIKRVIQDVAPDHVYRVVLATPAGDVSVSGTDAPVVGTITQTLQVRAARTGF